MLLLRLLVNALALMLVAFLVPGVTVSGLYAALIAAIILGLVNALVRPVLILLTFPVTILTLGLFTLFINGLLFWLVSTAVKGFEVNGFGAAFVGALFLWVVSWFTNAIGSHRPSRPAGRTVG